MPSDYTVPDGNWEISIMDESCCTATKQVDGPSSANSALLEHRTQSLEHIPMPSHHGFQLGEEHDFHRGYENNDGRDRLQPIYYPDPTNVTEIPLQFTPQTDQGPYHYQPFSPPITSYSSPDLIFLHYPPSPSSQFLLPLPSAKYTSVPSSYASATSVVAHPSSPLTSSPSDIHSSPNELFQAHPLPDFTNRFSPSPAWSTFSDILSPATSFFTSSLPSTPSPILATSSRLGPLRGSVPNPSQRNRTKNTTPRKKSKATQKFPQPQCPVCSRIFAKQTTLNRHQESVHGRQEAGKLLRGELPWWKASALMEMAKRKHIKDKAFKAVLKAGVTAYEDEDGIDEPKYETAFRKYALECLEELTCSDCGTVFSRRDAAERKHRCVPILI